MRFNVMIILFVVYGEGVGISFALIQVASSKVYDYEIEFIKPSMISVSNIGGRLNVTVKYSTNSLVYKPNSYWWVNGRRVADRVDRYKLDEYYVRGIDWTNTKVATASLSPPDGQLMRASVLVPRKVRVTSLELQIVSDLIEIRVYINGNMPATGKTIFEYVPKFTTEMKPSGLLQYDRADQLMTRVYMTADDLKSRTPQEVTAEFIEADQCITPPNFEKKSSEKDSTFLKVWKPTYDDNLELDEMMRVNSDNYILRRVNISNTNDGVLPKGILSVSIGYKGIFPCGVYSGVRVTHRVVIQPPPHSNTSLIGEKTLAFLNTPSQYFVSHGEDLDITITAIGGKMVRDKYRSLVPTYPEIYLRKRGKKFKVIADVKRLLQREITIRFKRVTAKKAGRYVVIAKSGKKMIKRDIFVYVRNPTGNCGK